MERLTKKLPDGRNILTGNFAYVRNPKYGSFVEGYAVDKLADYEDAEEQGLLLWLPCDYNESLFWVVNGNIKEVWFKGIRCDKGYKPQIIARYMEGLSSKEEPITKLENIGKTVFLTKAEAEQALKQMGE